jgi:hypothetical protein
MSDGPAADVPRVRPFLAAWSTLDAWPWLMSCCCRCGVALMVVHVFMVCGGVVMCGGCPFFSAWPHGYVCAPMAHASSLTVA